MSSGVEAHVIARLEAASIARDPFPHCVIDEVFPADFYESIIDHWPEEESWQPLAETGRVGLSDYKERMVVRFMDSDFARLEPVRRKFWARELAPWLAGARFRTAVLAKFSADLEQSGFGAALDQTRGDTLIVSDRTEYAIGPHTDAPHRVASLLFYLPEDATFRRFGTSLYVPADGKFRCRGGPHHPFKKFLRVKGVDFLPNRLVAFPKSDHCFHGVERVDLPGIDRRLLIYNLRRLS